MNFPARIETGARRERHDPTITARRRLDPDVVAELMPIAIAAAMFVATLAAKALYLVLGLGPRQAVPSIYGLAAIASVIVYLVARQPRLGLAPKPAHWRTSARNVLGLHLQVFLVMFGLLALLENTNYDHRFLVIWFLLAYMAMLAAVAGGNAWRLRLVGQHRLARRVAIYGDEDRAHDAIRVVVDADEDVIVSAVFTDPCVASAIDSLSGAGAEGLEALVRSATDGHCDHVVLAVRPSDHVRIAKVMERMRHIPITIQLCADPLPATMRAAGAVAHGSTVLIDMQRPPLGARQRILKMAMDYTLAVAALLILSPVMIAIAIAIKLDSRGPVFFIQARGGYRHKVINVIKFRSMTVLENGPEIEQARRGDTRITRLGSFLRRTSLDELPQLFNVLRGDLSLVGPRPHALAHDEQYSRIVEQYASRHKIKPGITGWAQINGLRSATTDPSLMRERIKLDLFYIDNWSAWLDLKILVRTAALVLWDRHAY